MPHHPRKVFNDSGAVAQLGERYNGIVEVRGSIPLGSTINAIVDMAKCRSYAVQSFA